MEPEDNPQRFQSNSDAYGTLSPPTRERGACAGAVAALESADRERRTETLGQWPDTEKLLPRLDERRRDRAAEPPPKEPSEPQPDEAPGPDTR